MKVGIQMNPSKRGHVLSCEWQQTKEKGSWELLKELRVSASKAGNLFDPKKEISVKLSSDHLTCTEMHTGHTHTTNKQTNAWKGERIVFLSTNGIGTGYPFMKN